MAAEILQPFHQWCEHEEHGRVLAVTRETSSFGKGAMEYSTNYSRWIRKQNLKYERKKTIDSCNVEPGDWLVHNSEPNKDCGCADFQTHRRLNLVHPPAKVTQMISMM